MDAMLPIVVAEIAKAVEIEASMEVLNRLVQSHGKPAVYGRHALGLIQQHYVIELALALPKIFDEPGYRPKKSRAHQLNQSDVASIPLLLRLLEQERFKKSLCDRHCARSSDGHQVRSLINEAVDIWRSMQQSKPMRDEWAKVKSFRDNGLAHAFITPLPEKLPQYREIFLLVDKATAIMDRIEPAISGSSRSFASYESQWADEAEESWSLALPAVIIPKGVPEPPSRGLDGPA